jgi:hypothetical protein
MIDWIGKNKEWLFSGLGIVIFLGLWALGKRLHKLWKEKRVVPQSKSVAGVTLDTTARRGLLHALGDLRQRLLEEEDRRRRGAAGHQVPVRSPLDFDELAWDVLRAAASPELPPHLKTIVRSRLDQIMGKPLTKHLEVTRREDIRDWSAAKDRAQRRMDSGEHETPWDIMFEKEQDAKAVQEVIRALDDLMETVRTQD